MTADHLLNRLDPRVKLISTLLLLVMVISCRGFVFPILVAVLSLGLCLNLGVCLKVLMMRFAEPIFIAVMVIILKLFCSGAVPLFSFHFLGIDLVGHRDGLLAGLLIASRIFGAVSLTALLVFSTTFTELMAALAWLKAPRGFIEVALFAWRYLFALFDDAQVVYAAQKNRLGYAGLMRGMRSFGTLAGTLVIKAFDNSHTVTCAMVQRGYDGTMPLLRHDPFRIPEVLCSFGFLLVMMVIWIT
jgi:cobalt/nickel transport system permease protein